MCPTLSQNQHKSENKKSPHSWWPLFSTSFGMALKLCWLIEISAVIWLFGETQVNLIHVFGLNHYLFPIFQRRRKSDASVSKNSSNMLSLCIIVLCEFVPHMVLYRTTYEKKMSSTQEPYSTWWPHNMTAPWQSQHRARQQKRSIIGETSF